MTKAIGKLAGGMGPRSLRAQLGLFALSILAPALVCMAALLFMGVADSRRAYERELLATARALSVAVDQDLSSAITANAVLATSDAIPEQDWQRLRRRAMRASGAGVWMTLHDAGGRRIFNTSPLAGQDPPPPIQDAHSGEVQTQAQPGRSVVTDLLDDIETGRKVVAVRTPIRSGGRTYTLSHVIDPARFLGLVAVRQVAPPTMVTIIDGDRRVIARSRLHDRFIGVSATPAMIAAMSAADEGVTRSRNLEGVPTVVAYTRSPVSGWSTLVVVPRAVFEAPLYRNVAGLAFASLAILGFGAGVAFYYSRTIARELALLEEDAAALGHGKVIPERSGLISNFASLQQALRRASLELSVRSDRQRLMINELNHRVKNTLATVQSLAIQTFRGGDADAPAKFDTRLAALAAGHDLLTQTNWKEVALSEVIGRCAAPGDARLTARGPPVTLPPQAALALCMCIHELTTNSMKYGALSNAAGEVAVGWTMADDGKRLTLVWRERGGPVVTPPAAKGFGTRLIDRLLRAELEGSATRDYAPEGLTFTADIGLTDARRWNNDFDG